jgi:glycosyltransferase involved in cell wall biosynthesis
MRICLVYDLIYPYTVGGAERWYGNLAELLVEQGHEVDYLTLHHWPAGAEAELPGVTVVAAGPGMAVYANGRRRLWPPLRFGLGVFLHLARNGGRYDIVHSASFPYFSLLAAGLVRPFRRYRLVADFHETWTREYWRRYLGRVCGEVGWRVQLLCVRLPRQAFTFSQLYAQRLRDQGFRGKLTVLRGQYAGSEPRLLPESSPPVVVYAGRHIPEKRVPAILPALELAIGAIPELRGEIFGDGPDRLEVLRLIDALGLADAVTAPGFVEGERIEAAIGQALCLILPSSREGYGLVVVEAAALGTPTIVVAGSDNAAVELIEDGVNGVVAGSASAADLAAAIVRIHDEGAAMRESTAAWFQRNREELSLAGSLRAVLDAYAR